MTDVLRNFDTADDLRPEVLYCDYLVFWSSIRRFEVEKFFQKAFAASTIIAEICKHFTSLL